MLIPQAVPQCRKCAGMCLDKLPGMRYHGKRKGGLGIEKKRALITGISELAPHKTAYGQKTLALLAESSRLAIEDAGLQKRDIDGLLVTPPSEDSAFMWPAQVAEYLQIKPVFLNMVELGGASAAEL